jgi:hypothetical protein
VKVVLGSRDEKTGSRVNMVQSSRVDIASVDDLDRAGLEAQLKLPLYRATHW